MPYRGASIGALARQRSVLWCATQPRALYEVERVRPANVLVLETNHDVKLLQEDTKRPWSIKQRILSRHGHLSNEAAAEVVEQVVSANLRRVYLGHLSRDCNRPELAHAVISRRLQRVGAVHVGVETAAQDVPCLTCQL